MYKILLVFVFTILASIPYPPELISIYVYLNFSFSSILMFSVSTLNIFCSESFITNFLLYFWQKSFNNSKKSSYSFFSPLIFYLNLLYLQYYFYQDFFPLSIYCVLLNLNYSLLPPIFTLSMLIL